MKKTISVILVCVIFLLCACSDGREYTDLHKFIDEIKPYFDENTKFYFTGDEETDEILEFTYCIEDESLRQKIGNCVMSVNEGMKADTIAVFEFTDDAVTEDITTLRDILSDTFVWELGQKLAMYDNTQFRETRNYGLYVYPKTVAFVISPKHKTDIQKLLSDTFS